MHKLFVKQGCAKSSAAKMVLKGNGIEFTELVVKSQEDMPLGFSLEDAPVFIPAGIAGIEYILGFTPVEYKELIDNIANL